MKIGFASERVDLAGRSGELRSIFLCYSFLIGRGLWYHWNPDFSDLIFGRWGGASRDRTSLVVIYGVINLFCTTMWRFGIFA